MEIANSRPAISSAPLARVATKTDANSIMRLLNTAAYSHVHVDWHLPVEWLGTPGFVVKPAPEAKTVSTSTGANSLFAGDRSKLLACLAVAADPPPAAWVRLAAVASGQDEYETLAEMMAKVTSHLRGSAVLELGWLVSRRWPEAWLPRLGFERVNAIETYIKAELSSPRIGRVPGLTIRPASVEDLDVLEEIECGAFEPLWRHSAHSLAKALNQVTSFDVALIGERIVAFQLSTHSDAEAHLVRITVREDLQGRGIGSALLAHAIEGYRERGLRRITLNTQIDNIASQHLYEKFNFQASGERLPVWCLKL